MSFIALDFDGVLCDSASETASSAWKCAWQLWPDLLQNENIPEQIRIEFLRVRPYLETGWQSVLMIRMLLENQPLAAFQNDLQVNIERLLSETKLDVPTLIKKFAESRDDWIRDKQQDWLDSHRFYPGSIQALQKAMHKHEVWILTTKQQRFTNLLLKGQGVDFPEEKILGLETKRPKEELLEEFARSRAGRMLFVEDRLETLYRVLKCPTLKQVRLYYALWGYGSAAEQQQARDNKAITCLEIEQFNQLLSVK